LVFGDWIKQASEIHVKQTGVLKFWSEKQWHVGGGP